MMKANSNALSGVRSTSSSQDSMKLKKSISSSFVSKLKGPAASSPNSMIYSIKPNHLNSNSKSNKKLGSQHSHSNKSFKTLGDSLTQLNADATKRMNTKKPEAVAALNDKKVVTAVPVKSLKQKAIGKGLNESTIHTTGKCNSKNTSEKENEGDYLKKNKNVHRKLFVSESHHLNSQIAQQSLLNFSCLLAPSKEEELNLSMFEVGRKLGRGRFGDVYMAREIRSGLVLAIKMVNKQEVKDAGMQGQMAQQIKIQLYSSHPNVLKMYGFFQEGAKIYLLLELATNGCLFKQIRNQNHFDQSLCSFYFRQVSNGARYLHSNSVIHRDIKPENILNCFNVLKICDFGWAVYSPVYQRQTFCGTLDYVPPEIVTGDFYDERADIWCLGVLCYELATGRAPFESKSDQNETYDKILKVEIDFPSHLSPAVVDFISRILHRDPTKRMSLQQAQAHEWMRKYENEAGRMISKEIWESWIKLTRLQSNNQ